MLEAQIKEGNILLKSENETWLQEQFNYLFIIDLRSKTIHLTNKSSDTK